jgi:anti-sigma B factor antagonist
MQLQVNTSIAGQATVVAAIGELDLHTAPELDAALGQSTADKVDLLVVDLTGVDFMDSTGLSTIVTAVAAARGYGGDVRVVAATDKIRKVFTLTGVDQQVGLFGSLDEATSP